MKRRALAEMRLSTNQRCDQAHPFLAFRNGGGPEGHLMRYSRHALLLFKRAGIVTFPIATDLEVDAKALVLGFGVWHVDRGDVLERDRSSLSNGHYAKHRLHH